MQRREFLRLWAASLVLPAFSAAGDVTQGRGAMDHVAVDPRIELMSIVHLLAGYFLLTRAHISYKEEVTRYFSPYRSHAAVNRARALAKEQFSFDRVPNTMLRLTDPPQLAWRSDLVAETPEGLPAAQGLPDSAERDEFLSSLRDFAVQSDFLGFFEHHRPFYRMIAGRIESQVAPDVRALEAYVGASIGEWRVIPGALLHDGGFSVNLTRRDGVHEAYAVIGPDPSSLGEPNFGAEERLQNLVTHEFGHVVINPLSEQQPAVVARYESRWDAIKDAMAKRGYTDAWQDVVNEHVIRAVTARLAARRDGKEAAKKDIAQEIAWGFVYVPPLVERLRIYESNRERWPTLSAFYPELLTAFETPLSPPPATP